VIRRWYVWVGIGAVVLVVAVVIAAAVRPRPQSEYDEAVQTRFVDACAAQGGEGVRDTCECFYGKVADTIPFDRFELLDETLAIQTVSLEPGQPLQMPEDVNALLQECVNASG
jgi:hypothetical protein